MKFFISMFFAAMAGVCLAFAGFDGWRLVAMLGAMACWNLSQRSDQ